MTKKFRYIEVQVEVKESEGTFGFMDEQLATTTLRARLDQVWSAGLLAREVEGVVAELRFRVDRLMPEPPADPNVAAPPETH